MLEVAPKGQYKWSSNIATYIGATVRRLSFFGQFLHGYDAFVDTCMNVLMKEDTSHTINSLFLSF